jgi:hypothetical protein
MDDSHVRDRVGVRPSMTQVQESVRSTPRLELKGRSDVYWKAFGDVTHHQAPNF